VNVCIVLHLFVTLSVTVSETERAFNKLGNQLKTWKRALTSQKLLNCVCCLAIEHELVSSIDFNDVISDFK
jgi:uncharacterized membrane protein YkvI